MTETTFVLLLPHDFNSPRNEGGFHEVVLSEWIERNVHRGDIVDVADDDGTYKVRGRVRCLVAIVEELP